jgi:hypothetical protein
VDDPKESESEVDVPAVIAPWSSKGWYGQRVRRHQDPEIQAIIRASGSKRINPIGFAEPQSPALAVTAAAHNPYLSLIPAAVGFLVGVILWTKLSVNPGAALAAASFFWAAGLFLFAVNVIRIRSWHRARRNVRAYLLEHHGEFPKELKWYS